MDPHDQYLQIGVVYCFVFLGPEFLLMAVSFDLGIDGLLIRYLIGIDGVFNRY